MDLNTLWFLLLGVLLTGYTILDGFDLGIGILHLFTRDPRERRISVNAIGPVWDGNEVWLLVAGGILFSVFPIAYATLLSAFYLLFILLLASLIFRAVSLEFRNKVSSAHWQRFWDLLFGSGSLISSFVLGVMLGNIILGIPLNKDGTFTSHILSQLSPYPLLIGLLSLILFGMHGGIYMTLKTEGALLARMRRYVSIFWIVFVVLYPASIISTSFSSPYLFKALLVNPFSWAVVIVLVTAVLYIPVAMKREGYCRAFLASSVMIACTILLTGLGLFPLLVPSNIDHTYSLTIYNASAGPRTLAVMLIIVLSSLPLVIGYTIYIHRVFRGKVILSEEGHY